MGCWHSCLFLRTGFIAITGKTLPRLNHELTDNPIRATNEKLLVALTMLTLTGCMSPEQETAFDECIAWGKV
jgi:hypothetical protein